MNLSADSGSVLFLHCTDILDFQCKLHSPGHQGWNPMFIPKGTLRQLERKCSMQTEGSRDEAVLGTAAQAVFTNTCFLGAYERNGNHYREPQSMGVCGLFSLYGAKQTAATLREPVFPLATGTADFWAEDLV